MKEKRLILNSKRLILNSKRLILNSKRLILNSSLLALKRTPGKTALFGALIFALTALLSVCALLLYSCGTLLARRDRDYVTTALALAAEDGGAARTEAAWAAVDAAALADLPGVTAVNKAALLSVWPQGYQRALKTTEAGLSVLALKILEPDPGDLLCWRATVTDVLYSAVAARELTVRLDLWTRAVDPSPLGLTPENAADLGYAAIPAAVPAFSFSEDAAQSGQETVWYYLKGTPPAVGHTYLACTSGLPRGVQGSGFPLQTLISGEGLPDGLLDVTDQGPDANDPAQKPFFDLAARWERFLNPVTACLAADPTFLEDFTQGGCALTAGEFYAPDAEACCLLPADLARQLDLGVGDTVTLECLPRDGERAADGPLPCRAYCVTGLLERTAEAENDRGLWIFLSDGEAGKVLAQAGPAERTLATLRLRNDYTQAELAAVAAALPDGVELTIFDQGWAGVTRTLTALLHGTLRLTGAALLAALALLALFAYLFVGKQRETLETLRLLGVSEPLVRRYAAAGAGLLLAGAAALGCSAAAALSGVLNRTVARLLSDPALAYSNASLGIVKLPSRAVLVSVPVLLCCWALIAGLGLCFCLRLVKKQWKPGKRQTQANSKTDPPLFPGFHCSFSVLRRYRITSVLRQPVRSLAVLAVSLLLPLFLMGVGRQIAVRKQALADLTAGTRICGWLTDYSGKTRRGLLLQSVDLEVLDRLSEIGNVSFAYADLAETPDLSVSADCLVCTNDLRCWLDDAPEIDWLSGWDDSAFAANRDFASERQNLSGAFERYSTYSYAEDPRVRWIVAPEAFLKANGLRLGDTVTVRTAELGAETPRDRGESYLLVGAMQGSGQTLFTCLENRVRFTVYTFEMNGTVTEYRELSVPNRYHACRFELKDTARLQAAKNELARAGVSRVRSASRYRIYPVFDDKAYLQAAQKIENSLASFRWLLWIAGSLFAAAGAALAWLLLARRRTELAVLRSLGASKGQVFRVFFWEQAGLCLGAAALAALLWRCFLPWGGFTALAAVFAGGFVCGTALAACACLKKDPLTVLHETEG